MAHDELPVEGTTAFGRGISALEVARRILVRVDSGAYATLALSGELERARLGEPARALCTELVYGSLRRQIRLDRALLAMAPRGLSGLDPQVRSLLRLGAYQILFMRIPTPLAVSQVVDAVRRLRGAGLASFANALLRRLSREGEPPLPELPGAQAPIADFVAALAPRHGLPPFLVEDLVRHIGGSETAALCNALESAAAVWLRLNSLRGSREEALAVLKREGIEVESELSANLPEAVRLAGGHPFAGAAYGEGWFTAQDLGAQLVARLLLADAAKGARGNPLPDGPLLDACAGVGGKTTHLAALTDNRREIDAADASPRKLALCRDHVHRLGCRQVQSIEVDLLDTGALASALRPQYAAVLLDAPCSGVGVLRRHPEARHRVTPEQVRELSAMQRRILANLAPRVMPGGLLVYAVCSFLSAEGTEQTGAFLRDHPDFQPLPPPADRPPWQTVTGAPHGAISTLPHRHDADGFYAVRLQRRP